MKTKLTVTVDRDLLPRAKRHAKSRGVSLSRLIEDALRAASASDNQSFAQRWRGKFKPARRSNPRYRTLAEKYL
ncbi:MAG: ribbon-helix-helix protein, CopG family [Gemmatimonadetes bacterium]|nr:ribbon-helix-helix protein, CopG family [Gemmatimonadota bacterium]